MKVIIPMAGKGQRFLDKGYTVPKPFIDIRGQSMIELAVDNLNIDAPHIFIMQKSHYDEYKHVMDRIMLKKPGSQIIKIDEFTQGPASTCLKAKEFIDDQPLLYANCDQFLLWEPQQFIWSVEQFYGGLLMYRDQSDYGSFLTLNPSGYVDHFAEKEEISDISSTGVYYWSKGTNFVKDAESMIKKDRRALNGEFYAINVYNEAIERGEKIVVYFIKKFWRLGVPHELETYLEET